jgi:hypothetical protein
MSRRRIASPRLSTSPKQAQPAHSIALLSVRASGHNAAPLSTPIKFHRVIAMFPVLAL